MNVYKIIFTIDKSIKYYDDQKTWEDAIEYLAETTPYDIDVRGNVCYIDNGNFED